MRDGRINRVHRRWTSSEDDQLVAAHNHVPSSTIASRLHRTRAAVKQRAGFLGPTRPTPRWSAAEDAFLRRRYKNIPTQIVGKSIGRTQSAVHSRAYELGLTTSIPPSKRRPWTEGEIEYVKQHYGKVRPLQIAKALRRSRGAIHHKADLLGVFSQNGNGEYIRRQAMPRTAKPFTGFFNPADLGYVAGILDGEGSVGRPPRVFISVTTTTKSLAIRLRNLAGGSIAGPYLYGKTKVFGSKRCRVKPQYHWNYASRYHAYLLLKAVRSHLVVKAMAARTAIEYFEKTYGWGIQ